MGRVRRHVAVVATACLLLAACSGNSASTRPSAAATRVATTRATPRVERRRKLGPWLGKCGRKRRPRNGKHSPKPEPLGRKHGTLSRLGDVGDQGQPATAVVPAGPVRRLFRRRRTGLLPGREHRPRRSSTAAATSSPAGRRLRLDRPGIHDHLGARRFSRHARSPGVRPRRHRPDLPALGHAVGVVEGARTSPSRRTSRARRSASGTSATSSR